MPRQKSSSSTSRTPKMLFAGPSRPTVLSCMVRAKISLNIPSSPDRTFWTELCGHTLAVRMTGSFEDTCLVYFNGRSSLSASGTRLLSIRQDTLVTGSLNTRWIASWTLPLLHLLLTTHCSLNCTTAAVTRSLANMAPLPKSQSLISVLLALIWACISQTPDKLKNPVFAIILSTEKIVEHLLSNSSLTFATGLSDVVQSAVPPTIAWFKSLPTATKKLWAVYLIVLEKRGCRPKIYIGSSCQKARGILARFGQYDANVALPRYVELAVKNGYAITHMGLLC